MGTEYLEDIIQQFEEIGGTTVIFGGGEPFTRADMPELIEFATDLGLATNVETNGTLLTPGVMEQLSGRDVTFVISLDGFLAETHDEFRNQKGAHASTVDAIDLLLGYDFAVRITTALTRKNVGEITDIVRWCLDKKRIGHRLLPVISRSGRGSSSLARSLALTPSEISQYLNERYLPLYREYVREGKSRMLMVDLPRALLPPEIATFSTCAWGIGMIGVGHDGRIGLCHYVTSESPYFAPPADESRVDLESIWFDSPTFRLIRSINASTLQGICGNCIHARVCRGLCRLSAFQEFGDIYAPYPVCQQFYDEGLFPESALKDPAVPCRYERPKKSDVVFVPIASSR
jgi:radical SAM protein with 4Fe4S-binding SPASM domain